MKIKEIKELLIKTGVNPILADASAKAIYSYWSGGTMKRLTSFVGLFNEIRKTNYKASPNLLPNFDYWLKVYTPAEMLQAVRNCDKNFGEWMDSGFSPTKLLRRKNKAGDCDYIGDLLNYKPVKKSSTPTIKFVTVE